VTNKRRIRDVALLLALPIACASEPSSSSALGTVTDTRDNKFDVDCASGLCRLTPIGDLVPKSCMDGVGTEAFVLIPYPLLSIYAVRVSYGGIQLNGANPSRPVACTSNADCLPEGVPVNQGTCFFTCSNGLCRTTSSLCARNGDLLTTNNVLTLCQADIPWPKACPYITIEPYAHRIAEVAAVCGASETCATVPADCRQPIPTPAAGLDGGVSSGIDGV
jgi:hypothetical protein